MVNEPLSDDVYILHKNVKCNETTRLKTRIRTGVDLFIGCPYLPTQGNVNNVYYVLINLI